jgi:glycosyltransferase involved in cell wall biosynthesis
MSRILIDGRFIGVGESVQRYTLEVLVGVLGLDKINKYTLLVRPQGMKIAESAIASFIKSKRCAIEVLDIPHYSISEQTKLLKYLNKNKYDLVHFTQFNHPIRYRGDYVVTIHDLTMFGHLHRMNPIKKLGFVGVMKSAVKDSQAIITISNTSRKDIIESYKVNPEKIVVTYLGVDNKFNLKIKNQKSKLLKFRNKYKIGENYILYTGMWKKHKNLVRLLKAFEQYLIQKSKFKSQNYNSKLITKKALEAHEASEACSLQLVLVGKIDKGEPEVMREIERINTHTDFVHPPAARQQSSSLGGQQLRAGREDTEKVKSEIRSSTSSDRPEESNGRNPKSETNSNDKNPNELKSYNLQPVVATGFIDEEELPVAYAGAMAYVIPSLSEGFGLPPLEAMACGTPVLSAKTSAMPEILGGAPLYFDPYNIDDIAKKIEKIAGDEALQAELSKRGLEQVKKYSWGKTAKETLSVYKSTLR